MTTKKKLKMLRVIRKDATRANWYYRSGGMCVIGGLLHAAGWTVQELQEMGADRLGALTGAKQGRKRAYPVLREQYGLTMEEAIDLQSINDENADTPTRRQALIEYVKSL